MDGLDEAYMSGGLTLNDLKNLYERLNKTARQNKGLKIILTSRLHYLRIDDPSVEGSLILKIDVFTNDQIKEYLNQFELFYPDNELVKKIDSILQEQKYRHIKELIEQPVLMYFIALSDISLVEQDSRADIYNKIFDSLAKRSWDKNGQLSYIKGELKNNPVKYGKYLRRFIRKIAFEIYQSPQHYISLNNLIELEVTKEFVNNCFSDESKDDANAIKEISQYLLISFYFQESDNKNDGTAIEFFHNSLWEYLTAEYIWEENKRIILKTEEDGDYVTLRYKEYYDLIHELTGDKVLEEEIRENLESIIRIEQKEKQEVIVSQLNGVFQKLVDNDMLLYYNSKDEKLLPRDKMRSNFDLAWSIFHWSNYGLETRIKVDELFMNFYFRYGSPFYHKQNIRNVDFTGLGVHYKQGFYNCSIENVSFTSIGLLEDFSLDTCQVMNTTFEKIYDIDSIENSTFNNVTFRDVHFSNIGELYSNTFDDVNFIDCSVSSEFDFMTLVKNNKCSKAFIDRHQIITKTTSRSGLRRQIYYLTQT